ncbi:MAG: ATP-binding protein [Sulfuricaulis sp.]
MPAPGILVIGNYCQTITIVRSLAQAGYDVILGRDSEIAFSQFSRHTRAVWRHPDIKSSEDEFAAALADFLNARKDITFVFPVGETDMLSLMRHQDAIPPSTGQVMVDPATANICFDKIQLYEIVSQLGIPQAPYSRVSSYAELESTIGHHGYPSVVKPNNSHMAFFGKKALIVTGPTDLKQMLPVWPEGNEFLIVQQFVRGLRHNCHFIADRGRLLSYFEQRVLRTDEPDGTGVGVHSISCVPTAKLREYCAALTQKLNYSGAGCVQFLVDARSGAVSFLEINPRLDATCAVPFHCGYDFPRMAVAYAEYRRGSLLLPPTNFSPYPVGKHGVSLWRDILGWRRSDKTKQLTPGRKYVWLKDMTLSFFRGDVHLTWSWKDPLPTCYRYTCLVASAFIHVGAIFGIVPWL